VLNSFLALVPHYPWVLPGICYGRTKQKVWRRKSPSGVQGRAPVRVWGKPPEDRDMLNIQLNRKIKITISSYNGEQDRETCTHVPLDYAAK